jgi:hypothetical protein
VRFVGFFLEDNQLARDSDFNVSDPFGSRKFYMPIHGLDNSFKHDMNGMTRTDMKACVRAATQLNEVIIFRTTGPWSLRWIKRDYPTKNFHVKGKSSDWGPQAGFVPYLGMYSKVGGNKVKEDKGTAYNDQGIGGGYSSQAQLCLKLEELFDQRDLVSDGRTALTKMIKEENSDNWKLYAKRSSDGKEFAFLAEKEQNFYKISVYKNVWEAKALQPLMVMTSGEAGAQNKPLTGDYDLMSVCPTWGSLGSRSVRTISKPGLDFGRGGKAEPGQSFAPGVNLDAVLDMRVNTGFKIGVKASQYNDLVGIPGIDKEHGDMGNLTARNLRCINTLNTQMGQIGPFRRVHHNAESHRNAIFGGISRQEMEDENEGFPLTAFQPTTANINSHPHEMVTLLNQTEFKNYACCLHKAGFFVPRSWLWGMSLRDGFNTDSNRPPTRWI